MQSKSQKALICRSSQWRCVLQINCSAPTRKLKL